MCSWTDYVDGTLAIEDLMDMHRSLALRDNLEAQARPAKE